PEFLLYGGGNFRFWEERDPHTQRLIAIRMWGQITEGDRTIWMDGRPHPPAWAQHTWMGFSTGKYDGNILTVYTTHLKRAWIRRNGLVQSDQTTVVEHYIRHGDRITFTFIVTDPVYLAEPLIRTTELIRSSRDPDSWLYACDDGEQIVGRADDQVPHYLFGQYPYLREYSERFKVPLLAALGGPETMYPEFVDKLKDPAAAEAAAPDPSLPGSFFAGTNRDVGIGATIIAHQNVQNRMSAPTGQVAPTPSEGWPTDTFLQGRRRKYYNDEGIEAFWEPAAVTDGD